MEIYKYQTDLLEVTDKKELKKLEKDYSKVKEKYQALIAKSEMTIIENEITADARRRLHQLDDHLQEALEEAAKIYGAKGLAWMKVGAGNSLEGGVSKFFDGLQSKLLDRMGAQEGDMILFVADQWKKTCNSLGAVRIKLAKDLGLIDPKAFAFCRIIDFPLFEYNEERGHWEAAHHMFSMPQAEYLDTLESDPGSVKGDLYDLVLNGYEVASGSIRIHDVELQKRIFRICNFDDETAEERFGFLLNAFRYGAPPHGGIAPGVDRMIMIMAEETSIHEVIAFPKNTAGISPMDDSPSLVDEKQLEDLHLIVKYPEPKS